MIEKVINSIPRTITENELRESLRRLHYGVLHAEEIIADVEANRDPELADKDAVRDANGTVWQFIEPEGKWKMMGAIGFYGYHTPKRPLKKLT